MVGVKSRADKYHSWMNILGDSLLSLLQNNGFLMMAGQDVFLVVFPMINLSTMIYLYRYQYMTSTMIYGLTV